MTRPVEHVHTFSGAGEIELQTAGRHVLITEATDTVYLAFDSGSELKCGNRSNRDNGEVFTRIRVRSLVAQTVRLLVSYQKQDEGRDDVSLTVSATLEPGNTWEGVADHTPEAPGVEQVLVADADRLTVTLTNPSTNTGNMRASGTAGTVGAGIGTLIEPGQSVSRGYTGAVWVWFEAMEPVVIDVVKDV